MAASPIRASRVLIPMVSTTASRDHDYVLRLALVAPAAGVPFYVSCSCKPRRLNERKRQGCGQIWRS